MYAAMRMPPLRVANEALNERRGMEGNDAVQRYAGRPRRQSQRFHLKNQ
jgi:hypothetical protein